MLGVAPVAAFVVPTRDDELLVDRAPRLVRLVAIRHRQRVGIFDGERLVACVTRQHYRASRMLDVLARRREYAGLELRIHTPHRRRRDMYFEAIDACDAPTRSADLLGRRPTWAMRMPKVSVRDVEETDVVPTQLVVPFDVPASEGGAITPVDAALGVESEVKEPTSDLSATYEDICAESLDAEYGDALDFVTRIAENVFVCCVSI